MKVTKQEIIDMARASVQTSSQRVVTDLQKFTFENNFKLALAKVLGRHAWSAFFKRSLLSNRSSAEGESYKFRNKFALPPNFSRMFAVATNVYDIDAVSLGKIWDSGEDYYLSIDSYSDYEKDGGFIFSNSMNLYLAYLHDDLEKAGPLEPSFVSALVAELSSLFAYSLNRNTILQSMWSKKAEQEIRYAINADELSYRNTQGSPAAYGVLG